MLPRKADPEVVDLLQELVNATIRSTQVNAQLKELQENILFEQKLTNQLLKRLGGIPTNEMPAVRAKAVAPVPPPPYDV
jgi:hypothetical protein